MGHRSTWLRSCVPNLTKRGFRQVKSY
jgi:hypothetical protein